MARGRGVEDWTSLWSGCASARSILLVDLLLCDDVVEGLVGVELHPLNVLVVLELEPHPLDLGALVLPPYVALGRTLLEQVELLSLESDPNHQDFALVDLLHLLDGAVVEAAAIANSVAVILEAHEGHDHDLGVNLLLVGAGLHHAKKMALDQVVAPLILSELERLSAFHDDGEGVVELEVPLIGDKLSHHGEDVHLVGDGVVG
mmetsp:Transcript_12746/g.21493  ORF Transcript_12746/g.21493 Transcript_12746/m.21493 type:complete len:204 (-) Transcript_12746:466-1077(-)